MHLPRVNASTRAGDQTDRAQTPVLAPDDGDRDRHGPARGDLGDLGVPQRRRLAEPRFSQSSNIPHVWNIWIVYPILGLAFLTAVNAWFVYFRKPISESQITREIERQARA
jgi:hypothetical protein